MNKVLRPAAKSPEALQFGEHQLMVLRAVMAVAAPEEGCALLLGPVASQRWSVAAIWPCLNVWQPASERTRRFAIDPREQLLAQKWSRQRGWQVHGSAHSHPGGPLVPSATDRALAFTPTVMVIGAAHPGPGDRDAPLQAWWLDQEAPMDPRPLTLLIGDRRSGDHGE